MHTALPPGVGQHYRISCSQLYHMHDDAHWRILFQWHKSQSAL